MKEEIFDFKPGETWEEILKPIKGRLEKYSPTDVEKIIIEPDLVSITVVEVVDKK